jgi:dolichol-phosphate mannosyltransferase
MKKYTIISDAKKIMVKEVKKLSGKKDISIVIPSYNEEDNIPKLIQGISTSLKDKYDFEIVIVDDASKDNTKKILSNIAFRDKNVVAVFREGIRGIMSAQMDGVMLSRGKVIVFMDADLSHPPNVIPKMMEFIPEYDFVSASRYIKEGGMKGIPIKHYISTNLFNLGMKLIMGLKATDYTGVFHAIKKDNLMQILPKKDALAGEFDLDLLYNAKRKHLKFKEVPFTYTYRIEGASKSKKMRNLAYIYGTRALKLRLFGRP